MRLEVWFDFICPFCYMGKKSLEMALKETGLVGQIEVIYKSFELDPNEISDRNTSINVRLAEKYGITLEEAQKMNENVKLLAQGYGLDYYIEGMKQTNTFNTHRLMKYAETKGKGREITEGLFRAYFTEGKFLDDIEVLASLAEEVGLNREEVLRIINSQAFSNEVRKDERQTAKLGITGVPYYLFNGKYTLSGLRDVDTLSMILKKMAG